MLVGVGVTAVGWRVRAVTPVSSDFAGSIPAAPTAAWRWRSFHRRRSVSAFRHPWQSLRPHWRSMLQQACWLPWWVGRPQNVHAMGLGAGFIGWRCSWSAGGGALRATRAWWAARPGASRRWLLPASFFDGFTGGVGAGFQLASCAANMQVRGLTGTGVAVRCEAARPVSVSARSPCRRLSTSLSRPRCGVVGRHDGRCASTRERCTPARFRCCRRGGAR